MSRIGIIADVHSNLPALSAVTSHADRIDEWWCLGDTVGYGPWPNECIAFLKRLGAKTVAGNHDLGVVGGISLERFNRDARIACEWTGRVLDAIDAGWLAGLPERLTPTGAGALLVHGSPRDPLWEYILSAEAAAANFKLFEGALCFNGHSHVPALYSLPSGARAAAGVPEATETADGEVTRMRDGERYLVNAGSVGQPRDGDPRACYVVLDTIDGWFAFHRVAYDISVTQARMEEEGLPVFLARRLALGR